MLELFAVRGQLAVSVFAHATLSAITWSATVLAAAGARRAGASPEHSAAAQDWWDRARALSPATTATGVLVVAQVLVFWSEVFAVAGATLWIPLVVASLADIGRTVLLARHTALPRSALPLGTAASGWLAGAAALLGLAWLAHPHGADIAAERALTASPLAAVASGAGWLRVLHVSLGSLALGTTLFAAGAARRGQSSHAALAARGLLAVLTLQALVGATTVRSVGHHEPVKLAAMVAQWEDRSPAPLEVASWPYDFGEKSEPGVELPSVLSAWIHGTTDAKVEGLLSSPMENRPPVAALYVAFQAKLVLAALAWLAALGTVGVQARGGAGRWSLTLGTTPAIALLWVAGWLVAELGRSPWTIRGALRIGDALWLPYGMAPTAALWVAAVLGICGVAGWRIRRLESGRGSSEPTPSGNV
jgi:cytochrome d ubiquinol oxidase subunit I